MSARRKSVSLPTLSRHQSIGSWPTEREILNDIAHDFLNFDAADEAGRGARIVPGFERITVRGVPVGEWLTSDAVFGDGHDGIVGASFVDDRMAHKVTVFRRHSDKARYEQALKARRLAPKTIRDDPEKRIEDAIADALRAGGHTVKQQVKVAGGIVDIVDYTAKVVIECKCSTGTNAVMAAIEQLDRYLPSFPEFTQALGLPHSTLNPATARSLAALNIAVFTPDHFPLKSKAR